jgi:hypothetical protein
LQTGDDALRRHDRLAAVRLSVDVGPGRAQCMASPSPGGDPVIDFPRDGWTVTAGDATLPVSVIIGTGPTPTMTAR